MRYLARLLTSTDMWAWANLEQIDRNFVALQSAGLAESTWLGLMNLNLDKVLWDCQIKQNSKISKYRQYYFRSTIQHNYSNAVSNEIEWSLFQSTFSITVIRSIPTNTKKGRNALWRLLDFQKFNNKKDAPSIIDWMQKQGS